MNSRVDGWGRGWGCGRGSVAGATVVAAAVAAVVVSAFTRLGDGRTDFLDEPGVLLLLPPIALPCAIAEIAGLELDRPLLLAMEVEATVQVAATAEEEEPEDGRLLPALRSTAGAGTTTALRAVTPELPRLF